MSWFGGWQVGYQSWVLAVSGFVCLVTRHPSGNVKYEAAYVGVEFRESPRPVPYKDLLFKTSKLSKITNKMSIKREDILSNDQALGHAHTYSLRRLSWNERKR